MADEESAGQDEGADTDAHTDENNGSDDGTLEFNEEFDGIDYDNYDDNIDYIAYADYVEPQEETDENGNVYVDYIVQPSDYDEDEFLEYPYDDIEVLYSEEVASDELADAPVTRPSSENPDAVSKGTQKASSAIPKMGDGASAAELALMAAAGASAAMAAYSKRRISNERAAAAKAAAGKPSGKDGQDDV